MRLLRVLEALSEAELGTRRPAEVVGERVLPILGPAPRRALNLAARLVDLAPLLGKWRTFTSMRIEDRREWLRGLKPTGLVADMVGLLEFLVLALYYVDRGAAESIGYRRWERLPPLSSCSQPRLSSSRGPRGRYDVVVVGSGAGGAVAAWRLASLGYRVALFEAGPEPRAEELVGEHPVFRALKYYWDAGLTFTWGTPVVSLPYGKVLGGTVTVNSGTMFRVPGGVLEEWRRATGARIDPGKLGEAYSLVEGRLGVRPVPEELLGGNARVMREGAEALGLSHGPVRRPLGDCRGLGECAFGCPCRGKVDMRLGFLADAAGRGLEVFAGAEVRRVLFSNGRARGVHVEIGGSLLEVEARAVVVAAGALSTPRLLRASGVGGRHLGRHLHIHPAAGVSGVMPRRVEGWVGTMQSYYVDDLLEEHHTLLLATFPPPGIGYSAASLPVDELSSYPRLASIGVQSSDDCTGSVSGFRLAGVASYDLCPDDLEKVRAGVELAAEILFAAGAERVYPPLKRAEAARSVGELRRMLSSAKPRAYKLSAYHPMSTARMADGPDSGVVDGGGRVFGYEGLYVADASVLPSTTRVNPQLTINALALMIADNVAQDLGGP